MSSHLFRSIDSIFEPISAISLDEILKGDPIIVHSIAKLIRNRLQENPGPILLFCGSYQVTQELFEELFAENISVRIASRSSQRDEISAIYEEITQGHPIVVLLSCTDRSEWQQFSPTPQQLLRLSRAGYKKGLEDLSRGELSQVISTGILERTAK